MDELMPIPKTVVKKEVKLLGHEILLLAVFSYAIGMIVGFIIGAGL